MLTVLNIPTDSHKFYRQYLVLVNPMLGKNQLRMKELELLANFYRIYDSLGEIPEEQKNTILFHKNTVRKIIMEMDLSRANYDNLTYALRKKNFIILDPETGTSRLNPVFVVGRKANHMLTLKFNINDSK